MTALRTITRLQDADDLATPQDGKLLQWQASSSSFIFVSAAGAVSSVFGRSGAVVAASGDYTAAQVTNAADKTGTNIFSAQNSFTGTVPTANNAAAGVYIGINGTPRVVLDDGTHSVVLDNNSGDVRLLRDGGVVLGYAAAGNVTAMAVNLAVGFDNSTPPPYSARFYVYHNVGAGTTVSNSTVVFEQNTNGTPAAGFGGSIPMQGKSSTTSGRLIAETQFVWATATDATRKGRWTAGAHDSSTSVGSPREGLRVESDGSQALFGAFGGAAVAKPTVTGSRGGNAALASLLTALANLGWITDSTSA